jgi:predicted PurR-regulated permease PerM
MFLVLLSFGALAGGLAFGVFQDLDREVRKLQIEAPLAAQRIESNAQFGDLAAEVDLDRRVTEAMRQVSAPSSGITGDAIDSIGAYVVCAVLTVLFLAWGPRLARGFLNQLDSGPADRVRLIVHSAFTSSRRYVAFAIAQSAVVGTIGWLVSLGLGVPAPAALGLALAAFALVPTFGIVIGSLPILLLVAGLEPAKTVIAIGIGILVLQVVSNLVVQPRIVKRSHLYVGPAMLVIGSLIGFELYGIGGAMYAGALTVLGVAVIDAATQTKGPAEEQSAVESHDS